MDAETMAMVATLRSEIATLRAEMAGLNAVTAGGEGADVGLPITPLGGADYGAFRFEGTKITHCNFQAGQTIVELEDVEVEGNTDGTWWLRVNHNQLEESSVTRGNLTSNVNQTAIKLFTVVNGAITKDYRGMPFIPLYS